MCTKERECVVSVVHGGDHDLGPGFPNLAVPSCSEERETLKNKDPPRFACNGPPVPIPTQQHTAPPKGGPNTCYMIFFHKGEQAFKEL